MNEEELAAFLSNSEAANLSGGDFFRVKCCGQKALKIHQKRFYDEQLLIRYLGQLGRIGNNLNQIAHALNIARFKPDAMPSIYILERHEDRINEIKTVLDASRDMIRQMLDAR